MVLAKRGGINREKSIHTDKIGEVIRILRSESFTWRREKVNAQTKTTNPNKPNLSPATRVARGRAGKHEAPGSYKSADYVDQEGEPRRTAHGPRRRRAEILPHDECYPTTLTEGGAEALSREKDFVGTIELMTDVNKDPRLTFLTQCSSRMSSFLKARAIQDYIQGLRYIDWPTKNGYLVAIELGLPTLQEVSSKLLEEKEAHRLAMPRYGSRWRAEGYFRRVLSGQWIDSYQEKNPGYIMGIN